GPITTIASGPVPEDGDESLGAQIAAALDEITGEAISAVGDLVASAATAPEPGAVRGIEAVARELADPVRGRRRGYRGRGCRDPGAAGGRAGLGRAAPGRDRRAATGPLRPARRPSGGGAAAPRGSFLRLAARAGGARARQTRVRARVFTGSMARP